MDVIFGGYGFIGKALYKNIKRSLRFTSSKKFSKKNLIKYTEKNFLKIIKKKPKNIFFLSGISSPNFKEDNYKINLLQNLKYQAFLEAAKKSNYKGKIFYFSSIAVYGSSKKSTKETFDNLKPESFYALSKIIAEQQSLYYSNKYNLNIVVLRLCSVFGPSLKRQIIYKIFQEYKKKGNSVTLHGRSDDSREFIYIDDLVKILLKLKSKKISSGIYNIGSEKKIKISQIVNFFNKKKQKKIIYLKKLNYPNFKKLNTIKLKKIIKYKLEDFSLSLEKYLKKVERS